MTPLAELIQELFNPRYAAMKRDRMAEQRKKQSAKADVMAVPEPLAASEPTKRPSGESAVTVSLRAANDKPEPWRWPDGTHIEKDWIAGKWFVRAWVPGATRQFHAQGTSSKETEGEVRKEFVKWLEDQKQIEPISPVTK